MSPVELKEIVYQSVAYVGMARAFDYLHATNDALAERGVESAAGQGSPRRPPHTREEKGLAVQREIVGDERGRSDVCAQPPMTKPHFQRYLSANCFGDHLHPLRR